MEFLDPFITWVIDATIWISNPFVLSAVLVVNAGAFIFRYYSEGYIADRERLSMFAAVCGFVALFYLKIAVEGVLQIDSFTRENQALARASWVLVIFMISRENVAGVLLSKRYSWEIYLMILRSSFLWLLSPISQRRRSAYTDLLQKIESSKMQERSQAT